MDWEAFERILTARARSADDAAALGAAARAIVAEHGDSIAPKHVDAFVRARSEAGATAVELAVTQRAGDALVHFAVTAEPAPDVPKLPPEILAKMPASFFAASGGDEEVGLSRLARRYAWALDALAIAVGLVLLWLDISTYAPVTATAYDLQRGLLRRIVGWVGGLTLASGAAGFATRAGWLDGPQRLHLLRARGAALARGVWLLASLVLLVVLAPSFAHQGGPSRADDGEWPSWMTDLGVMGRLPPAWTYQRTSEDQSAEDRPLRVAWLRDAFSDHAITITRGDASVAFVHAIAVAIARDARLRTDGITCRAEEPATHADAVCVRNDSPQTFVTACKLEGTTLVCLTHAGIGTSNEVVGEVERTLRDLRPITQ